jgi:hypothetical protein
MANDANIPAEARERAEIAARTWKDTPGPILIRAALYDFPWEFEPWAVLHPVVIDGGWDLAGIRIREERRDPNGTSTCTIVEEYPVYVRRWAPTTADKEWIAVTIRDRGQRKDFDLWEEYLIDTIDFLIAKYARNRLDVQYRVVEPPTWVSSPDSEVDVFVSVYDRAGHESEYVRLENLRGPEHTTDAVEVMFSTDL